VNDPTSLSRNARRRFRAGVLAALWGVLSSHLAGCDDGQGFCTAQSVPGIAVKVLDADTGGAAACGATAWLVSDSWSERADSPWNCSAPDSLQSPWIEGAFERAGTYTVLVLKEGYAPWSRSGVRVSKDDCHVHTVSLEAHLVRAP
jgi:hypothetical protein